MPKYPTPAQEIDIDNNTRFRYQVGYWCPLIDASLCGTTAKSDTQFTIFDLSALEKQLPIFYPVTADETEFSNYESHCGRYAVLFYRLIDSVIFTVCCIILVRLRQDL